MPEDFRIDLKTEDIEDFYWSLLNQFQRIFRLPESEQKVDGSATPVVVTPQKKLSSEQVRDRFLEAVQHFKIMEIINRRPPIFNRMDSATLNVFLRKIDVLISKYDNHNDSLSLYTSISTFTESLQIQALSIEATLNWTFDFDDENASINMEDDGKSTKNKKYSKKKITRKLKKVKIPELSVELIANAEDPCSLIRIKVEKWANFRDEMNLPFHDISSWHDTNA